MRKLMNKKLNKKGFTLMEMLIVVAIIAILVAIAIPTFSNALNKAKVATDEANLRAYYADKMVDYMMSDAATPSLGVTAGDITSVSIDGNSYTIQAGTAKVVLDGTDNFHIEYTPTKGSDTTMVRIPGGK
mgnify:CR=1 FL=1